MVLESFLAQRLTPHHWLQTNAPLLEARPRHQTIIALLHFWEYQPQVRNDFFIHIPFWQRNASLSMTTFLRDVCKKNGKMWEVPPIPPVWEHHVCEKIYGLFCILGP